MATRSVVVLAALLGVAFGSGDLDVINLPLGFQPEGIAFGRGWTGYVGSISGKRASWLFLSVHPSGWVGSGVEGKAIPSGGRGTLDTEV